MNGEREKTKRVPNYGGFAYINLAIGRHREKDLINVKTHKIGVGVGTLWLGS